MRLICPNCGAQYEVDDAVIPDNGRDVQCSNCGHTWFQQPAHLDADLAEELGEDFTPPEIPEDEEPLQRQELDPEIADILREEAEHETSLRNIEGDQANREKLESQPDLGLGQPTDAAAERSAAARARMARLRGLDEQDAEAEAAIAGAAATTTPRRELLPDVEEINSSLRASDDRATSEVETENAAKDSKSNRKGGRRAFTLVILIVAVGLALYAFAPQIIAAIPQTEPYLVSYVEWANQTRGQIDIWLQAAIAKVQGLIGSSAGE